jgi:uncharacterized protein
VHQDGLVHVSQLADRFVKDPHEVVKAGDVVKVRVTEVDVARKRIALTMRKDGGGTDARSAPSKPDRQEGRGKRPDQARSTPRPKHNTASKNAMQSDASTGAFGAALLDALKKK